MTKINTFPNSFFGSMLVRTCEAADSGGDCNKVFLWILMRYRLAAGIQMMTTRWLFMKGSPLSLMFRQYTSILMFSFVKHSLSLCWWLNFSLHVWLSFRSKELVWLFTFAYAFKWQLKADVSRYHFAMRYRW